VRQVLQLDLGAARTASSTFLDELEAGGVKAAVLAPRPHARIPPATQGGGFLR
jgi:hypothetical protein